MLEFGFQLDSQSVPIYMTILLGSGSVPDLPKRNWYTSRGWFVFRDSVDQRCCFVFES